jgi:hypothetical protein
MANPQSQIIRDDAHQLRKSQFLHARGIAKEIFHALGGGEAFLKAEREHFYVEPLKKREPGDPLDVDIL